MGNASLAKLAFFLLQLVTATLLLRPADLIEGLNELPLYEGLLATCLLASLSAIAPHFRWQALLRQPISLCIVGMFLCVILSHATHAYLGGMAESSIAVFKAMVYFALVITLVNTPARLHAFLLNLAVCSTAMCVLCLLDYWGYWDFTAITPLLDLRGHDAELQAVYLSRMRGVGIFQDPNDLAMIIVAAGVLCFSRLTNPAGDIWRFGWLVPIGLLAVGLFETKSRGGLLAAGCAGLVLSHFWFGRKVAATFAVCGVVLMLFVAGRSSDLDAEDGSTAHERMLMWRDGFDALKSPSILFGVGQGMYTDFADLVAHNSFVHAYVELGVIGGTMYFGCFFFAALQLYRMGQMSEPVGSPELVRLRPYFAALLAGWCGSMFSLSRCYVVPTFLVIGLMATYSNLVWIHTKPCRPLVIWNQRQMFRLGFASALTFISLYVFTMIAT